ncbi:peptidylprolyl isomerase [candidate division KSB1 bacterium]|nr:peptidylprolyl isomerase [candidate division KSB1 bacterium]
MIISVNGEKISKEICEQEIQNVRRNNKNLKEDKIQELAAQNIIDWTIIRQEANKKIVQVPEFEIEKAFQELKNSHGGDKEFYQKFHLTVKDAPMIKKDLEQNIKVRHFLNDLTAGVEEPDEKAVKKYYTENHHEFINPEQVHAAHIVKEIDPRNPHSAYLEMKKIRNELINGADFAETANNCSSCNDSGGDLGFFSPGKMVEEFETIVFSMKEKEISPVFRTQFGYHIATVYEKVTETQKELKECRDDIKERLLMELKDSFIAEWVDQIKEKAEIKITYSK